MPRSCQGDLRIIILRDQCCFHSCSFVILHQCYVVIRTGVKNAQMYPPSRRTTAFHNVNYILSIDISVSGQSGHYQSPCARFDYLIQLIKSNVVSCRSVGAWGAHAAVYSSVVCQSFDPVIELFSRHAVQWLVARLRLHSDFVLLGYASHKIIEWHISFIFWVIQLIQKIELWFWVISVRKFRPTYTWEPPLALEAGLRELVCVGIFSVGRSPELVLCWDFICRSVSSVEIRAAVGWNLGFSILLAPHSE